MRLVYQLIDRAYLRGWSALLFLFHAVDRDDYRPRRDGGGNQHEERDYR
jgi:hypothetical protein